MWTKKRLLIWGKTYPEFSKTYFETVCTGAVDGDTGRLVRIYPITLRYSKEPFKVYDWIEAEVERNESDFRPESYRIQQDSIRVVGHVGTTNGWADRSDWVLRAGNVFRSVEALRATEAADHTSLGLVRPKAIVRVYAKRRSDEERGHWEEQRERALAQREMFVDPATKTRDLAFVPIQYRAQFTCDDPACSTEHDLSILDWGLYVLHRRQFKKGGPQGAERDVIAKIQESMDSAKRDAYFFLGNTKEHPCSFMIVGLYYPALLKPKKVAPPTSGKVQERLPGID